VQPLLSHRHRYPSLGVPERQPQGPVELLPYGPTYLFWPPQNTVLGRAAVPIFTALRPPVKLGSNGAFWDFQDTTGGAGNRRVGLRMNRSAQYESTWEVLLKWRNTGVTPNIAAIMSASPDAATNPKDHTLGINATGGPTYAVWDGSATREAALAGPLHADGEIVHLVATSRFNFVTVYTNGVERGKTGSASPGEFYTPAFLVLGGAAAANFNCEIYYAAWYDRQLSPAEIGARAADPYGRLVRPMF